MWVKLKHDILKRILNLMSWRFFCGTVAKHQLPGSPPSYEHRTSAPWVCAVLLQGHTIARCCSMFFIMYLFLPLCHKQWGTWAGPRPLTHVQQRAAWSGLSGVRYKIRLTLKRRETPENGEAWQGWGDILLETVWRRNEMRNCGREYWEGVMTRLYKNKSCNKKVWGTTN